jgi:hypothetical protein
MPVNFTKTIPIILIMLIGVNVTFINVPLVEGAATGGKFFCEQFPTYPECTGWRVEPIYDNYWFCEYVDLPTMCKFKPDPKKQIFPMESDECCKYFESRETIDMTASYLDPGYDQDVMIGKALPEKYPVDDVVIWTDKDHYVFGDRVNVYGKFDFSDTVIKKGNKSVDVEFNNHLVVPNLPVDSNGWFSGFFRISDSRFSYTALSHVSITYFHTPTMEQPDKYAQTSYQFTTGDISPPKESLKIVIEQKPDFGTISYHIADENNILVTNPTFFISRITNPDNVSFPLPTTSMDNLEKYLDEISDLIPGKYEITVTVGDFVTEKEFHVGATKNGIPSWIKNNAEWWANDDIDDSAFVQGIQYLIQEEIIEIPDSSHKSKTSINKIPPWIKNTASLWAEDQIDDTAFVRGIQYLIQ